MRRREFITLIGGAAAWPLVARAREMPRIAVLLNFNEKSGQPLLSVFLQEIRRLGWIDGETAHIDIRWVQATHKVFAKASLNCWRWRPTSSSQEAPRLH